MDLFTLISTQFVLPNCPFTLILIASMHSLNLTYWFSVIKVHIWRHVLWITLSTIYMVWTFNIQYKVKPLLKIGRIADKVRARTSVPIYCSTRGQHITNCIFLKPGVTSTMWVQNLVLEKAESKLIFAVRYQPYFFMAIAVSSCTNISLSFCMSYITIVLCLWGWVGINMFKSANFVILIYHEIHSLSGPIYTPSQHMGSYIAISINIPWMCGGHTPPSYGGWVV